jgi:hypothetical protein
MSSERNNTADDTTGSHASAVPTVKEVVHEAENGHDNVVRLGFRERPFHDDFGNEHPTKMYFDTFRLYLTEEGYFPVLVSSVLIDTAIRH